MKRLWGVIVLLLAVSLMISCGKTEYLNVEVVETGSDGGKVEDPDSAEVNLHSLFSNAPGTLVPLFSIGGTIDPVGTTLIEDFDGDGINNNDETTTNIWVADYPVLEAYVAAPVTMKVLIEYNKSNVYDDTVSEIESNDTEHTSDNSMESAHRNELNDRTVQYQDTIKSSSDKSKQSTVGASLDIVKKGANKDSGSNSKDKDDTASGNFNAGNSSSNGFANETTTTNWKNVPFKNNLNRNGWRLKGSDASENARDLRKEIRNKATISYEVKPDSGTVRAALYIKNESVNMPVKVKNILCSLMLETPQGALLPVQSFKLVNEDHSKFQVSIYGGATFGPYVINFENLNSFEIMEAVNKGYNPRIFIVDYEMEHVEDSNYKQALTNFQGDNLRIIEENAKGRTAGIKLVCPETREFYRVAAFNTLNGEESANSSTATILSPGVPLEKALRRISYSFSQDAKSIEMANYVFDLTGIEGQQAGDANAVKKFFIRCVKGVRGLENVIPVDSEMTIESDPNGDNLTTYFMKPINLWTQDDYYNFRIWAVFDKGKYYDPSEAMKDDVGNPMYYALPGGELVPMYMGVKNIIWPGDHYDIVYLDMAEYMGEQKRFGRNPFETGEVLSLNTRWNMSDFDPNRYYFYPDSKSVYLGDASPGDIIEFNFKLDDTYLLNADFGTELAANTTMPTYENFAYTRQKLTKKFNIDEALDFELSFGLGGSYTNWINLKECIDLNELRNPFSEYIALIDKSDTVISWDFFNQEFKVQIKLPYDKDIAANNLPGVGPDGLVKIYMRPALNNAYRETIWPLQYNQVKKFRGILASNALKGDTVLRVRYGAGAPAVNDRVRILTEGVETTTSYLITTAPVQNGMNYEIQLSPSLLEDHRAGDDIYINYTSGGPYQQIVKLALDKTFISDWNNDITNSTAGSIEVPVTSDGNSLKKWTCTEISTTAPLLFNINTWPLYTPARDLGIITNNLACNWIGNYNYCNPNLNNWADASNYNTSDSGILYKMMADQYGWAIRYTSKFSALRLGRLPDYDLSVNSSPGINAQNISMAMATVSPNATRVIAVWDTNIDTSGTQSEIYARFIDASSGSAGSISGSTVDLKITSDSSTGNKVRPQAAISNIAFNSNTRNKALVVWQSDESGGKYHIYGRIVDVTNRVAMGSVVTLSTNTTGNQTNPRLAISGSRAIVVWQTDESGFSDIRGQVLDITGDSPVLKGTGDLSIGTINTAVNKIFPQAAVSTSQNRAVVAWYSMNSGSNDTVSGRLLDISKDTNDEILLTIINPDEFTIGNINSNAASIQNSIKPPFSLAVTPDRALVVWPYYNSATNYDIYGRAVNITAVDLSSILNAGGEFSVSTTNTEIQRNPDVAIAGTRAIVVWRSGAETNDQFNIYGQVMDVKTDTGVTFVGKEFLIGNSKGNQEVFPRAGYYNSFERLGLVVWDSYPFADFQNKDILGRVIDATNAAPKGIAQFLVSCTNSNDQFLPQVALYNTLACVVWISKHSGNNSVRGIAMQLNPAPLTNSAYYGLSNFFVSPLVERDYRVKVNIK